MGVKNLNAILVGPGSTDDFQLAGALLMSDDKTMRLATRLNVASAGSTTTDATILSVAAAVISPTGSGEGVRFASAIDGGFRYLFNAGASNLNVYPPTGGYINNSAADGAFLLSASQGIGFFAVGTNKLFSLRP